jgi:hypothetical protein
VNKIDASENKAKWLEAGGKIEVWGWDKPKHRWRSKVVEIL